MRALLLVATLVIGCQLAPPVAAPETSGTPNPSASAAGSPQAAAGWRRIADIPTGRSEVAAAVASIGDKVFVIGGFGGLARVERYEPAANTWDRAPDYPIGVDHAMAVAVNGLQSDAPQGVFVFGGYLGGGPATARSFRFDQIAERWNEIEPMPAPRAAAAAVAIGDRIFIVGGANSGNLVSPTYEYNVSTRQWRTVAAIPTPRDHLAAVEVERMVCAVGGRRLSMSANLATFECYDPRANTWAKLPEAPTARGGVGAAAHGRRVYFIGGEQPSGTFKEVEIFDFASGAWTRGPDLSSGRHGIGVVVVPGTKTTDANRNLITTPSRLLVLTGGPAPGGSQTVICEALDLN